MSDEDIDKAVKEAAEYEAQDKKRKEGIDARNDADAIYFQTQKAMEEVGDKLDAADKSALEADLNELKAVLDATTPDSVSEEQVEKLKAGKEKVMASAQKLYEKLYAQAGAQGGAGPDMGAGSDAGAGAQNADDGVVDGDYREV